MTTTTESEIRTQPDVWRRAAALAATESEKLPHAGESVLIVGCGTSWFIAQAYAKLRESAGQGLTDASTATEAPLTRSYDRLIALSRSGTTTEIIELLRTTSIPSVLITAVGSGPAAPYADAEIVLDFADETSVVQTRFATSALVLLRTALGGDLTRAITDAETVLASEPPRSWIDADQITFLGTGWTKGLADEAALKMRESSQSWTESYYSMEYRHGPIAIAQPGRVTFQFGPAPAGLAQQTRDAGSEFVELGLDPLAELVAVHVWAVRRAEARGLDPDVPRNLTRAVHLSTV